MIPTSLEVGLEAERLEEKNPSGNKDATKTKVQVKFRVNNLGNKICKNMVKTNEKLTFRGDNSRDLSIVIKDLVIFTFRKSNPQGRLSTGDPLPGHVPPPEISVLFAGLIKGNQYS